MTEGSDSKPKGHLFSGPFFRREALAHRFRQRAGNVFVRTPLTAQVFSVFALFTIVAIAAVLFFGRITPYVVSNGVLLPKGGVEQVLAPSDGVITTIDTRVGERVSAGQLLFTMTVSPSGDATAQAAKRAGDLQRAAEARTALSIEEQSLQAQQAAWADEKKSYQSMIEALDTERRALGTVARGSQALRALEIVREQSRIHIELAQAEMHAMDTQIRAPQMLAQLRAALAADDLAVAQDLPDRIVRVVAQRDGVASNVLPLVGDAVAATTVLASISANDTTVLANVLLSPRAIDYAATGDQVQVRLRDFPVERYGSLPGLITEISQLPVTAEELRTMHVAADGSDPLFRATVLLKQQFITADGTRRKLHTGMLIDVEVGETSQPLWSFILHSRKHHSLKQAA